MRWLFSPAQHGLSQTCTSVCFVLITNGSTSPWVTPAHFTELLEQSSWIWWSLQALQRKQKHSETLGYHLDVIYFYANKILFIGHLGREAIVLRKKCLFARFLAVTQHIYCSAFLNVFCLVLMSAFLSFSLSCSFYEKLCFIWIIWSAAQSRFSYFWEGVYLSLFSHSVSEWSFGSRWNLKVNNP